MKILKPEFQHNDSRRSLTQLFTGRLAQVNNYTIKRGSVLGSHFHKDTTEYFYVYQGKLTARVNGRRYSMPEGSIFVVEPGEYHEVKADTNCGLMTFLTKPFNPNKPDLHGREV